MPVTTSHASQESSAAGPLSPPQPCESASPLLQNITSAAISPTPLSHHASEEGGVITDEDELPFLTLEEYERLHREAQSKPGASCRYSWVIAGIALASAVGAFAWNRWRASVEAAPEVTTTPEGDLQTAIFPPLARLPVAPVVAALREDVQRKHLAKPNVKQLCYQIANVAGIATRSAVPCSKGKQGKGAKRRHGKENLPPCTKRKVLRRCNRKQQRAGSSASGLVIKKKGRRCLCPPDLTKTTLPPTVQPAASPHNESFLTTPALQVSNETYPGAPLKRGNNFHFVDDTSSQKKIPAGATTVATTETADDVQIKKMFDLRCAAARKNLSWAQVLRQFGNTLMQPSTEAYKEGKIVYDYIIKKTGCPSEDTINKARWVTMPIDIVASTVISLLPGATAFNVAQGIIAPILDMIADSLEGKNPDVEQIVSLNLQIMMMLRPAIPTLSRAERASLYGKLLRQSELPAKKNTILAKRYNFHDNQAFVNVDGKEYLLRKGLDDRPFIDKHRLISFNHRLGVWENIDKEQYTIYNQENMRNTQRYRAAASLLPDGIYVVPLEYGFVKVINHGKPDMKGVFLAGDFIPADWEEAGGELVTYTHDGNYLDQRVIHFTDYGWMFEAPSVKMDKNLEVFLASCENGIDYYPENRISAINEETGLCHSAQRQDFIKSQYKYYAVDVIHKEKSIYALDDDIYTRIKFEKGMFKLTLADNMLFGLQNERVLYAMNEKNAFYMERAALDYLEDHGQASTSLPARMIRPGLHLDEKNNPLFIYNDKKYAVAEYNDRYVYIKRVEDGVGDNIALWSDKDSWLRMRDKPVAPKEYHDVVSCRRARGASEVASCLPVVIEKELHSRLQTHIDNDTTSTRYPIPGSLVPVNIYATPVLFQDPNTGQHYFLYGGKYFDASLIDTLDANNPTGLPVIRLAGSKGLSSRQKFIADIVLEEREGKVEIKEVDTLVAEKLNLNKQIAHLYNVNRQYRYQPAMDKVEELVSEAQASGSAFVEFHPRMQAREEMSTLDSQYETVKKALFPERIVTSKEHIIEVIALDADTDPQDLALRKTRQNINGQVRYLKEMLLPAVMSALNYDSPGWADVGMYLSILLDSSDVTFLTKTGEAFQQSLQSSASALVPQKIYLLRAAGKKAAQGVHIEPYLTEQERLAGKMVWVSDTSDKRIFINIDALPPGEISQTGANKDLIGLIIEELFKIKGRTLDIATIENVQGKYMAAQDVLDNMVSKIGTQQITAGQKTQLQVLSRLYLDNVPAYRRSTQELLSPAKLAYIARNDPAFLAHLALHSPKCLATMTQDIYYQLALAKTESIKWDRWVKSYAEFRELNSARKEPGMSGPALKIDALSKVDIAKIEIAPVSGKPGIYYAQPSLDLLFKANDNYYPIEFVGKNGRIVFVGPRDKLRHVYYYNPHDGSLRPIASQQTRSNELTYNRPLDLYQSIKSGSGEGSVLKYDATQEELLPTGAKRIVPLPNGVIKVEHPGFDLFYPENAGKEVFLAAHGNRQLTGSQTAVPENTEIFFYTKKWHSLHGRVDDLIDLVKGKIASTESKQSSQKIEAYEITIDEESQINYPWLAQESRKSLIRMKPQARVSSKDIIDAVSKMFSDKKIDIHLYICRGV